MDRSFYEKEIEALKLLIHRVNGDTSNNEKPKSPQMKQTDGLWIMLFFFFMIFGLVGFMTWWLIN